MCLQMEGASPPMLPGTQANSKETIEWEKVSNNQNFFFNFWGSMKD